MIFPSKLLEPAKQTMAGPSSSDGKIMECDNFQNYARKDQCIYITPHWNDDLKKIIEQEWTKIDLV